MTTQVIENREITAQSGREKRTVLADIVGKLCEAVSAPKDTEAFSRLQKKYRRSKQALRKLKAQGELLLQEVERNKAMLEGHLSEFSARDETKLTGQIRQLQALLKKQLASQTEFLHTDAAHAFEPTVISPHRKSLPIDDDEDLRPARSPAVVNRRVTPLRRPPPPVAEEEEVDEVPPLKSQSSVLDASHQFSASRQRREFAEREADEVLKKQPQKRKPKRVAATRTESPSDVNQLVDLTNQLRNDYRRLGQYFGGDSGGADLSIEQLSKLNDSLFTAERDRESDSR
jgi:hypothetical protein